MEKKNKRVFVKGECVRKRTAHTRGNLLCRVRGKSNTEGNLAPLAYESVPQTAEKRSGPETGERPVYSSDHGPTRKTLKGSWLELRLRLGRGGPPPMEQSNEKQGFFPRRDSKRERLVYNKRESVAQHDRPRQKDSHQRVSKENNQKGGQKKGKGSQGDMGLDSGTREHNESEVGVGASNERTERNRLREGK